MVRLIHPPKDFSTNTTAALLPMIVQRPVLALLLVCALLAALAWFNRFMIDDAFISFRYASNLVDGHGLVWNPGERVEGYTNFLWTLLISIVLYLHLDPVVASQVLGISAFVLTLIFTNKLAVLLFKSTDLSLLTTILLGINYTFNCYATGGIETQLQALFFVTAVYLAFPSLHKQEFRFGVCLQLSLIMTGSLLLRLDSVLIVGLILIAMTIRLQGSESSIKAKSVYAAALFAPIVAIVGLWFFWKLRFYGHILPNTFQAKVASLNLGTGIAYVYKFVMSYMLVVFPFLLLTALLTSRYRKVFIVLFLTTAVSLWSVYIVLVGGDFMEFRFMVPVLPFIFILITWLIFVFIEQKPVRIALIIMILLGDWHHVVTYKVFWNRMAFPQVEPIRHMHNFVYGNDAGWATVGKALRRHFADHRNVVIAVTAAGAIPYYSGLPAVDMHGLNDAWVALHGDVRGKKPGHQKIAPVQYLIHRKVNLVIGHPLIVDATAIYQEGYSNYDIYRMLRHPKKQVLPLDAEIVEIPIHQHKKLIALYLCRSTNLDEVIKKNRWRTYPLADPKMLYFSHH